MVASALAGSELGIGLDADLCLVHAHHLFFLAGPDADGDALTYVWRFDGAAPNMAVQDPGVIQFSRVGTYDVSFQATDVRGLSFPTPIVRTITVR